LLDAQGISVTFCHHTVLTQVSLSCLSVRFLSAPLGGSIEVVAGRDAITIVFI
jgi:hypothetical protein